MPEAQIVYENERDKFYPFLNPYRYWRNSFFAAGVDSLTDPPSQNEDLFMKLDNVQPVAHGGLRRRWGYETWTNPGFTPQRMYEYQSDSTGIRRILAANAAQIGAWAEDGTVDNANITSVTQTPRLAVSRDWAFIIDPAAGDIKKIGNTIGSWQVENWGIIGPFSSTSALDVNKYAGTVAQPSGTPWSTYNLHTTANWVNPTNAEGAPDGSYATYAGAANSSVGWGLLATNFGFALTDTGPIGRIKVKVHGFQTVSGAGDISIRVWLVVAGAPVGSVQLIKLADSAADTTIDLSPALWGVSSITVAQINASDFGVWLVPESATIPCSLSVDSVNIEVQSSGGSSLVIGTPGAGDITLTVGRIYYQVFRNSKTGHISDLSQPSVSTGPLTNNNVPLTNIMTSTDAQVDFVDILGTADGGDETTLYFIGSVANGVTSFTDDMPEATLLLQNTYLETDQFGNEIGVADNTPPPTGDIVIKHRGRLYISSGQFLYFSKSLGELTTSTGLIAGRYEEAWPADYVMDISAGAETISGLLSDGMILYIGTERHVRRLIGDGPLNFTKPDVTFAEVGVLNQEVWKVVYHEGMPTGVIWITPDFRIIWSDFNTYRDISPAVQGSSFNSGYLKDINQSAAATACEAEIVSVGPYDLYILAFPTGSNTVADTLLVFNIKTQQWVRWTLADSVNCLQFNVSAAGLPQLLFGANSSNIYRFGTGYAGSTRLTQDRVGGTAVNIPVTIQTSWLSLGDAAMRKALNNLEITTADAALTTTVEAATTVADFTSPYTLVSSRVLTTNLFGEYRVFPAGEKARRRFYRYTFFSNSTDLEVLSHFAQEVLPIHKH